MFTCLTTRAIHLEVASSLTTDSCILALRRFIGQRGLPREIYSDNGKNFHGTDRELKKVLEEISQERILQELSPKGINWCFNPPLCPHMGGSWERMICSIKTAISATVKERAPRNEVLQTLFVEAENIVNGHPLTHVSIDFEDQDALTPNHFLLGCSNATFALGTFTKSVSGLKRQWRIAQGLADQFLATVG